MYCAPEFRSGVLSSHLDGGLVRELEPLEETRDPIPLQHLEDHLFPVARQQLCNGMSVCGGVNGFGPRQRAVQPAHNPDRKVDSRSAISWPSAAAAPYSPSRSAAKTRPCRTSLLLVLRPRGPGARRRRPHHSPWRPFAGRFRSCVWSKRRNCDDNQPARETKHKEGAN